MALIRGLMKNILLRMVVELNMLLETYYLCRNEQICLARRFVSGYMYETNATFNTNTRPLPLSVMVGTNNTSYTFPMAFMFITSEVAKSFKFASEYLTDLYFHDSP